MWNDKTKLRLTRMCLNGASNEIIAEYFKCSQLQIKIKRILWGLTESRLSKLDEETALKMYWGEVI